MPYWNATEWKEGRLALRRAEVFRSRRQRLSRRRIDPVWLLLRWIWSEGRNCWKRRRWRL